MSGNEFNSRNDENDELIFTELIEQFQPNRDTSIQQFEKLAQETCEGLAVSYVLPGGEALEDLEYATTDDSELDDEAILDREIEEAIEDLDREWVYEGEIATVTGTLFVNDQFIGAYIPEAWGEKHLNEAHGTEYYIVENVKLRSVGVGIEAIRDVDNRLIAVKPTFVFALPNDEEEKAIVYAYAGELFKHEYETPSFQESERFLEHYHKDKLDLIQAALTPDGTIPLPQRVLSLVEQFQDVFAQSSKFMKCVEQYLQCYCSFDQKSAYKMVIENKLQIFDGSNMTTQADDLEMWQGYTLNGALALSANNPLIKFIKHDDGSIDCYFQVIRYNTQSGDADPEFIRARASDVTTFRSTEAERTLLSMLTHDMAQLKTLVPELFSLDAGADEHEEVELQVEGVESPEVSVHPSVIDELEEFEAALLSATDAYKRAHKVLYATPEEAMEASRRFLDAELTELLSTYQLAASFEMIVAGEGVRCPNLGKTVEVPTGEDDGAYSLTYAFNPEEPLKPLELGDRRLVMLEGVHASIESDEDAGGYRIQPSLTVIPRLNKETLAQYEGVSVLTSHIGEVMFVALDGSAEVSLPLLDTYRASQSYISTLSGNPAFEPIVTMLESLQDAAVDAVDMRDFVEFDTRELFTRLDSLVSGGTSEKHTHDAVIGMLDALLMRRVIKVNGEMSVKDFESGKYVPFTRDSSEELQIGKVMDIRNDISGTDLHLIIHSAHDERLVAVRMKTVTQLMF